MFAVKAVDPQDTESQIDLKKRRATAYVARIGNRDRVGDRIIPGAFVKTIKEGRFARGLVPVKYNHETLIGKIEAMEEDSKGLLVVQRISPGPDGDRILGLMQDDALTTHSFKYTIDPGGWERKNDPDGMSTRELKSVEVWEAGPVDPDLAANDTTMTLGFKGLSDLASTMGALANLEGAESWAETLWGYMSDEDKNALRALFGALPAVSSVVQRILEAEPGKIAKIPADTKADDFFNRISAALDARNQSFRSLRA